MSREKALGLNYEHNVGIRFAFSFGAAWQRLEVNLANINTRKTAARLGFPFHLVAAVIKVESVMRTC